MGTKYRARGVYIPTGRDSFVTTVWRDTFKEAQSDIACFCSPRNYKNTRVVMGDPDIIKNRNIERKRAKRR